MLIVAGFCDGGVIDRNPSMVGGSWAWCHVNEKGERLAWDSGIIPVSKNFPQITNNYAEMVAAIRLMESLPEGWLGAVASDSEVSLGRIFNEWQTNGLPPGILDRMRKARQRLHGAVRPVLLDGHPTVLQIKLGFGHSGHPVSEHNVFCDAECKRVMDQYKVEVAANV